jgi:hypothetical protein
MRSLFYTFLGYFLTIPGVMVMAALVVGSGDQETS